MRERPLGGALTMALLVAAIARCQAVSPPREGDARTAVRFPAASSPRDGGTPTGFAFQVAARVKNPVFPENDWPRRPSVTMSEGWACAMFESERGPIHQCWDAGPHPRAFTVPWMKEQVFVARDRYCEHDTRAQTFRCWQRPRRGDTGPREMPRSWQWAYPDSDGDQQGPHGDRLVDAFMGGTFACLATSAAPGLRCLGDNRFGQLGAIARPSPLSLPGDPGFIRGLGSEVRPALGTWHACALAESGAYGTLGPTSVVCWGRGDHGQLGAPAHERCTVGGQTVACARTPVRGPAVHSQMAVLRVGDLFTCASSEGGRTQCWGASRDGLFGVRGSCPESLRNAWPTPDGPVPAPNASCTTKPVTLPRSTGFDPNFEVAPREIRYEGEILRAVPAPRGLKLGREQVSPGSDASWCAPHGNGVVCWGEKYSPPSAPGKPVEIVFEPRPPLGDQAVIDGPAATTTKPNCQIHRPCPKLVQSIPPCVDGNDAGRPVTEILAKTESLAGGKVRVRGALGVGRLWQPSNGFFTGGLHRDPGVASCTWRTGTALVGGADGALAIDRHGCAGDESRACCDLPVFGQQVIATGRLEREREDLATVGWKLVDASLCEVRGTSPHK